MCLEYSKRRLVIYQAVTGAERRRTQASIRRIAPRSRLWILGLAVKDSGALAAMEPRIELANDQCER